MTPAARQWTAGLIELIAHLGHHLAAGLEAVAEAIDPDGNEECTYTTTIGEATTTDEQGRFVWENGDYSDYVPAVEADAHEPSDDCRCGVSFHRVDSPTGGDAWHRYHRTMTTEDA